ncbi:MAG TPA: hypothetical protein PLK40_06945 [Bacteroidaceae bacterium]|nr:hypothetical protein [Bacteroidaceae bacterium]
MKKAIEYKVQTTFNSSDVLYSITFFILVRSCLYVVIAYKNYIYKKGEHVRMT